MSEEKGQETTSERTARGRTHGAFRCLNCFERIVPPEKAEVYKCPQCGFEWRVSWPSPTIPRIRGPVWETNRRLTDEIMAKEKGQGK